MDWAWAEISKVIGELKGGAAPPGQQSMWGEKGVLGEWNGFGLGGSFTFHWRAL